MKKITLTFAALGILFSIGLSGQTYLGLKTGISVSNPQSQNMIDALNKAPESFTSFLVGVSSEISLSQSFSFQPELQFVKRGFSVRQGTIVEALGVPIPIGARANTTVNYIDLPLLAKAKLGIGSTRLYGVIGPSIGYALSAKVQPKVTLLLDFNLPTISIDLSDAQYQRTDIAAVFGAGVEHNLGSGKLFADVRYQHSFNSMINNTLVDVQFKNSGAQIALGYAHSF